ncbi:unnamed protein product, partial [Closterium sp. NIES-53]
MGSLHLLMKYIESTSDETCNISLSSAFGCRSMRYCRHISARGPPTAAEQIDASPSLHEGLRLHVVGFELSCMGDSSLSGASTVDGGGVAHGNVVCRYRSFVGSTGRDGASMDASWGTDYGAAITRSVMASGRDSECMETGVRLELGCKASETGQRSASSSSSGPSAAASVAAIESTEHWFCEVEEREPETR